ncbi:MAG: aminoglycoside phosphotransferase family protein [Acidimicrobiales bacterium]
MSSGSDAPGALVGRGRSADVYDAGHGRVLRRYRDPSASAEREAAVMTELAAVGFPVPEVFDASGPDLVMERLDGRTLLDDVGARPHTLWSAGALLADLHERLHAVRPTPALVAATAGRRVGDRPAGVLHLDLHPDNVVLTERGPVVIDWANVALGAGAYDVAYVWAVMTIASLPGSAAVRARNAIGRRVIRHSFLRRFDRGECAAALVDLVATGSLPLRNFDRVELARLDRLVGSLTEVAVGSSR